MFTREGSDDLNLRTLFAAFLSVMLAACAMAPAASSRDQSCDGVVAACLAQPHETELRVNSGPMAVQVFRLRGVPDDEAEEVRALLADNGIDFYETPGGSWGISMPALWLGDESQLERARKLIDDYQDERTAAAKAERELAKREGKQRSLLDEIREDPIRFVVYAGIALVVLYLSTSPFLHFGE